MRILSLALLVLLISVRSFGQAQTNLPAVLHSSQAEDHFPANVDSGVQKTAAVATPKTGEAQQWFNAQSDVLLQTLGCFLDKQSIENEKRAESKNGLSQPGVLAARVKLLATLVQKNSRNHCK